MEADRWESLSEANKKRYAGSAIGVISQNKVFLFGGRSDFNKYNLILYLFCLVQWSQKLKSIQLTIIVEA